MSNYTKTTDFSAKDDLPSGDPDKVVVGAELDAEFDAIQTAVATKADSVDVPTLAASNTFTGTLTTLSSTQPTLRFYETDATTDEKYWRIVSTGGQWVVQALGDSYVGGDTAIALDRSGATVTTIAFQTNGITDQMKLRSGGRIDLTNGTVEAILSYSVTPTFQVGTVTNHNVDLVANNATRMVIRGDGPYRPQVLTVATLPSASTAGAGARSHVSDANATTFASVVAGGGSNSVPVYSDGTNWRIG